MNASSQGQMRLVIVGATGMVGGYALRHALHHPSVGVVTATHQDKRIDLVTGANQGVGLQVAKELAAKGLTVLIGSRNFERGESAAKDIGAGAIALQLDVTDRVSIAEAAERIRKEFGRLDLLVQNAAISNTRKGSFSEWVPRSWPELTLQRGEGVGLHSAA